MSYAAREAIPTVSYANTIKYLISSMVKSYSNSSTMTELLQLAIAEIEKLPAEEQNAIATRILAELKDEQKHINRREFMKLSLEERRLILAEQAEQMLLHYQQDKEWQELETIAVVEYL
jgi:hypothetical protein